MLRNPKARITANLTIALYLALLATLTITTFYPVQIEGVSVPLMLGIKLLPLLAFAVPVFRGNNRGYIWLSFVVIFYFTRYVVSAWLSEGAAAPVILTILSFLLFTVAMIHLKVNRPVASHPQ
ncbi:MULTISPECIES: DUF2069 domain-containing protein [Marinobacter]|uniref:DUF2069 domain-containing protein n=1 Tax=Marinobacter profundi TaxID=2666256 RepID=A0A2G1UQD9_9GAMM|nr:MULTISPECIES: DUF2069 domain-containing protein [Marinobacter]MBD3656024.1 DUF2069 domain-containing protein [Marinobacter sp.]PHQ16609.1 hypothetical protein CLH61_01105 [Marinobacter profundi]